MKLAITVLCFIALDVITGLIGAIKNKTYKSEVMREGLFHKVGEIIAIAFAYGCEYAFPLVGITLNIPIAQSVLVYIIIMESGSIVENLSTISPEIRAIMEKTFKSYEKAVEDADGKHVKGEE